jgi:hypothetical protein
MFLVWFGIAMTSAFHLKNHFDVKNKTQNFKMLFNVFLIENNIFKSFVDRITEHIQI